MPLARAQSVELRAVRGLLSLAAGPRASWRRRLRRRIPLAHPASQPGVGGSEEEFRQRYRVLAESLLEAQLGTHLRDGSEEGYLDLRVALIVLAAHEGFSGFIMTGEAADFLAAAVCPYRSPWKAPSGWSPSQRVRAADGRRDELLVHLAPLAADSLLPLRPPDNPDLAAVLALLLPLPLGARAHAADVLRHLVADPSTPRTLASLSRYETRKRGLDVAESTRLIMDTGLVVPATGAEGLALGLDPSRPARFPGSLRRAAPQLLEQGAPRRGGRGRVRGTAAATDERVGSGGAESAARRGARLLRQYLDGVKETWRVWLGFGTGVSS